MELSQLYNPPPGDHHPDHHLTTVTTQTRYLPGSASQPPKKRPYVRKCFCPACKQTRLDAISAGESPESPARAAKRGGGAAAKGCRAPQYMVDKLDAQDCAELARDGKYLPGDYRGGAAGFAKGARGGGLRKRPSFRREEAFRDASTCKTSPSSSFSSASSQEQAQGGLTELEVAELYRLGILYDDPHVRGEGFNLDAIVHREPVFSVRPAKRQRRHQRRMPEKAESVFEEIVASAAGMDLPLDLSFADLGSDEAILRLLSGAPMEEEDEIMAQRRGRSGSAAEVPMKVIYEVEGEGEVVPSVDELPELTFEGDETQPSQETGVGEEDEDEEEGWDILPRIVSPGAVTPEAHVMSLDSGSTTIARHSTIPSSTSAGAGEEARPADGNAVVGATTHPDEQEQEQQQDAWIVLGDDS